jgi:transcriptional regulator with XRE-family HTH domain
MTKDINRIKVVLVEHKKTNKWLAEQLGKDPATISKWCTNSSQPSVETLMQIAKCLDVEVHDLLLPVDKVVGKLDDIGSRKDF